jgi:hypothetical protein
MKRIPSGPSDGQTANALIKLTTTIYWLHRMPPGHITINYLPLSSRQRLEKLTDCNICDFKDDSCFAKDPIPTPLQRSAGMAAWSVS